MRRRSSSALRRLPGRQGLPQRDHAGQLHLPHPWPGTDLEWFSYWKDYCENWLLSLGIKKEHLRLRDHEPAELAFYSRATTDIEYAFPFTDWGELWGIADRTNYDLSRHQEASGKSLEYFDSETNEHYIPYVIEPSLGCDRVALAFLCEAYDEEHLVDAKGKEDVRTVLHLHPALAPYKCAVLPLSKKLGADRLPGSILFLPVV